MNKQRRRLLILEKEPETRAELKRWISRECGYGVECVDSVQAAIGRLEKTNYAGLMLDTTQGEGMQILEWTQRRGRREPVIMMSYGADWGLYLELLKKGAVDLIGKPLQADEVKRSVQWVIGGQPVPDDLYRRINDKTVYLPAANEDNGKDAMDDLLDRIRTITDGIRGLGTRIDAQHEVLASAPDKETELRLAEKNIEECYLELACVREQLRRLREEEELPPAAGEKETPSFSIDPNATVTPKKPALNGCNGSPRNGNGANGISANGRSCAGEEPSENVLSNYEIIKMLANGQAIFKRREN